MRWILLPVAIFICFAGYLLQPGEPASTAQESAPFLAQTDNNDAPPREEQVRQTLFDIQYSAEGLGDLKVLLVGSLEELSLSKQQSFLRCIQCTLSGLDDVKARSRIEDSLASGALVNWQQPKRYLSHKGGEFWHHFLLRIQLSHLKNQDHARELSPWGPTVVRYQRDGQDMAKHLVSSEFAGRVDLSYQVSLTDQLPYIMSLNQKDDVDLVIDANTVLSSQSKLRLQQTSSQLVPKKNFNKILALAEQMPLFDMVKNKSMNKVNIAKKTLDGWDYQNIRNALSSGEHRQAFIKLMSWLRVSQDIDTFRSEYLSLALDPELFNLGTRALLSSGQARDQKLLRDRLKLVLSEKPKQAKFLISGMAMLEYPGAETVAMLTDLAAQEPDYKQAATLSLGAMAKQLADDDPTSRDEILTKLEEGLFSAQSESEILLYLSSLGNTGHVALTSLEPYFSHRSVKVRAAAIKALRFNESQEAYEFLEKGWASFSQKEQSNALVVLKYWPSSSKNFQLLKAFFLASQAESMQLTILQVMPRFSEDTSYQSVLVELQGQNMTPRVYEFIGKLLNP